MLHHLPHPARGIVSLRRGGEQHRGLVVIGLFLLIRAAGEFGAATAAEISPAEPPGQGNPPPRVCIVNGTGGRLILLLVTPAGGRLVQETAPGAALCMMSNRPVTAMSFGSVDALEGCSVKLAPGQSVTLLAHEDFDRCRWALPVPAPRH